MNKVFVEKELIEIRRVLLIIQWNMYDIAYSLLWFTTFEQSLMIYSIHPCFVEYQYFYWDNCGQFGVEFFCPFRNQ